MLRSESNSRHHKSVSSVTQLNLPSSNILSTLAVLEDSDEDDAESSMSTARSGVSAASSPRRRRKPATKKQSPAHEVNSSAVTKRLFQPAPRKEEVAGRASPTRQHKEEVGSTRASPTRADKEEAGSPRASPSRPQSPAATDLPASPSSSLRRVGSMASTLLSAKKAFGKRKSIAAGSPSKDHETAPMSPARRAGLAEGAIVGYAVVIGVGTYTDHNIPPVDSASHDADRIAEVFRKYMAFKVTVLRTDSQKKEVKAPTSSAIVKAVEHMAHLAKNEGKPLVVYCTARGLVGGSGVGSPRGSLENVVLPCDTVHNNLAQTALTVTRLKSIGHAKTIVMVDIYPNTVNSAGFCQVTGPPSVGTELKAVYPKNLGGTFTRYLVKGFNGYAGRDRHLDTNHLNSYVTEKMQAKTGIKVTTTSQRELVGDLLLCPFVPHTVRQLHDEKHLAKFVIRRIKITCILPLQVFDVESDKGAAWVRHRTLWLRSLNNLCDKAHNRSTLKKSRPGLHHQWALPTHIILVLNASPEHDATAISETCRLVREAVGRKDFSKQWSVTDTPGCDRPDLDDDAKEALDTMHRRSLFTVVSVPGLSKGGVGIALDCKTFETLGAVCRLWLSGELAKLCRCTLMGCFTRFHWVVGASVYDYQRLNRAFRLGLTPKAANHVTLAMSAVEVIDPATEPQQAAATSIQRVWKCHYTFVRYRQQLAVIHAEDEGRQAIMKDCQQGVTELFGWLRGDATAVVEAQETEIRWDMGMWEREERNVMHKRMCRLLSQMETALRQKMISRTESELDELWARWNLYRTVGGHEYHWIKVCGKVSKDEILQRQNIIMQEKQAWVVMAGTGNTGLTFEMKLLQHGVAHALVLTNHPSVVQPNTPFSVYAHIVDRHMTELRGSETHDVSSMTVFLEGHRHTGSGELQIPEQVKAKKESWETKCKAFSKAEIDSEGLLGVAFHGLQWSGGEGEFVFRLDAEGLVGATSSVVVCTAHPPDKDL